MPGEPGFAADNSVGVLEYVNDEGVTVREEMKPEMGDYGRVYDALYQTSPTVRQITSRNLKFLPIWKSLNADLSKPLPPQ
ncbi:putative oxidoreductase [Escherichia coli]|nr:putative oxidoreductase [Escherichia coli]